MYHMVHNICNSVEAIPRRSTAIVSRCIGGCRFPSFESALPVIPPAGAGPRRLRAITPDGKNAACSYRAGTLSFMRLPGIIALALGGCLFLQQGSHENNPTRTPRVTR